MPSKEYLYHGEEEREPTPQQLNAEMNKLYDHLPRVVVEGEWDGQQPPGEWVGSSEMDKWVDEFDRRCASEHKKVIMGRVTSFTRKAPITLSFQEFIIDQYSAFYNRGFTPEEEQEVLEQEFFFLDRGHPESGGIFDPKRVAQFEYQALARERDIQLSLMETQLLIEGMQASAYRITEALGWPKADMPIVLAAFYRDRSPEEIGKIDFRSLVNKERREEIAQSMLEPIRTWEKQIKQHYGKPDHR